MSFGECITNRDGLRSIYREPSDTVVAKAIDHVDDGVRAFIEQAPLVVVASGDGTRNDASPRGGPPGFVRVIDEHHLAFGDLVGNNRLDSYENIIDHAGVGMLCFVPGLIASVMLMFAIIAVVDRNLSPVDAIKTSFDIAKNNIGPVILVWLLTALIVFVGALLFGVGLLVAMPVAALLHVYAFRRLSGGQVAPATP